MGFCELSSDETVDSARMMNACVDDRPGQERCYCDRPWHFPGSRAGQSECRSWRICVSEGDMSGW